jgi:hypothetical protein
MHKRFRKVANGHAAEAWVDIGWLGTRAELYEDGEYVTSERGRMHNDSETEVFLTGRLFSALIRIRADAEIRCTWSR